MEHTMTDHKKPTENTGAQTTVSNPKPAGHVERVDPTTGGSAGDINTNDTAKH